MWRVSPATMNPPAGLPLLTGRGADVRSSAPLLDPAHEDAVMERAEFHGNPPIVLSLVAIPYGTRPARAALLALSRRECQRFRRGPLPRQEP